MASRTPPLDPRIANPPPPAGAEAAEESVRPVVALPRRGLSGAAIAAMIAVAAILLFILLDSRRRSQVEPATRIAAGEVTGVAPPPPLYVPPAPLPVVVPAPAPAIVPLEPPPRRQYVAPPQPVAIPQPTVRYLPQPQPQPQPSYPTPPQRQSNSPTLVIDNTTSQNPGAPGAIQVGADGQLAVGDPSGGTRSSARVRSGIFANKATTVAQGTLIPAVLETAFDSRRPGFARAIVSRDVRGFDGTRILIPRGSRLTGEYKSDIQPGQKRALINWTRLIRPDGVTIAIGSPAADTLGRGGVKGDYNSHFLERFAGAVLQSALEVGANLGTRAAGNNVIIGLPGSTQNLSPLLQSNRVLPTLTVPAGTSISIFVARDLDFTGNEKQP
jgi:type IV secretion system protein VirB10